MKIFTVFCFYDIVDYKNTKIVQYNWSQEAKINFFEFSPFRAPFQKNPFEFFFSDFNLPHNLLPF